MSGHFGEGDGGSGKSIQKTLCMKKSICESSLMITALSVLLFLFQWENKNVYLITVPVGSLFFYPK